MMGRKACLCLFVLFCVIFSEAGESLGQDDVADVPCKELFAGGDKNKRYFLIGGGEGCGVPKRGFNLLVVLPGGDGGANFNPFVKRIYKNSLSKRYLVAQLVSVKWTAGQVIVWPTKRVAVEEQGFCAEEFVEAVVEDIKAKYRLNEQNIFTLSWSSGGPAAYAISVQDEKSVVGSYIAMSVFKPDELGSLAHAAGHFYFIEHSPEDKVCPFRMAKNAHKTLREHGAETKLVTYKGGHGWHGNVFGRIRKGVRWLEVGVRKESRQREPVERMTEAAAGEERK